MRLGGFIDGEDLGGFGDAKPLSEYSKWKKLFSRKNKEKLTLDDLLSMFISFSPVKVTCYLSTISVVTGMCNCHCKTLLILSSSHPTL